LATRREQGIPIWQGFAKGKLGHVGSELALMLEGHKSLSVFYDIVEDEAAFERHVLEGRFVKAEETFDLAIDPATGAIDRRAGKPFQIRCVLYALESERWRLNAMLFALRATYAFGAYNDRGLEILKSMLLDYTAEEIVEYHRLGSEGE
jgi:hypothetical protein